jgi:shikimate kinase
MGASRMHPKHSRSIFLVGFMGSGKSTVGRDLAARLGWQFHDLDDDIERREQTKIAAIFDTRGEEAFRLAETDALVARIRETKGQPRVISLGGGAFLSDTNFNLVRENGVSIWLDCPLPLLEARLKTTSDRPLARDPERFRKLYEDRRPGYWRADHRIQVHGNDPDAAVEQILALGFLKASRS